jgi:multiple sugar transport system substrate-binding protein
MSRKLVTLFSMLVVLAMLLSACGGEAPAAPATAGEPVATEAAAEDAAAADAAAPAAAPEQQTLGGDCSGTRVRWYIGLGAGGNPEEIVKEEAFVEKFNAKYGDQYCLVMDIVQNATANDVLKTQIASGDMPDIVGPVGIRGMANFEGAWLDLAPLIEQSGYDLSDFNPELVKFYQIGAEGEQIGLPFAVYPSALWYNKELFDEAGLAYPPHEWGAPYEGEEWTFDKMAEIAKILTVDANGNDATSPDFDPENIVQFGYHPTWTDARGQATFFGAANFVDAEGNAVMPDIWRKAFNRTYQAIWEDHIQPNSSYVNSDLLSQGNTFGSGKVAMTPIHTWYTCCAGEVAWDVAAIPSFEGVTTAKLHADTFGILKGSKNQEAAWAVLGLMLGEFAPDLIDVYGAFPARASLQETSIASLQERFPDADWQVFVDALSYPDIPNHESGMPNFLKAQNAYNAFQAKYEGTPGLDMDKEMDDLVVTLQGIFDEVE